MTSGKTIAYIPNERLTYGGSVATKQYSVLQVDRRL